MDSLEKTVDKRLLSIASEVGNVANNVVPRVLVKLQAILDSYPQGSRPLQKVRQDVWSLGLTKVILTALKQDYSKILDGWKLCSKVGVLLCQCCAGLQPTVQADTFNNEFMPEALHGVLTALNSLQTKYVRTSDILEDTKQDLLSYLKAIIDSLGLVCSGPEELARNVLSSPWLLQLLMTDNSKAASLVMDLIQSLNRMKPGVLAGVDERIFHQLMDEIVFKITATDKSEMAGAACRTINTICECHTVAVELLCKRYRGLGPLLSVWRNRSFERDLRRLEQLLDAGSLRQAELQKKHEAVAVIQAHWRSYATRKKLARANQAFSTLHRSFRARRQRTEDRRIHTQVESELKHILLKRRHQAMRDLRSRQLEALRILPAGEVERFLQQEQNTAAIQIQRKFRGFKSRRDNVGRPTLVLRTRAVVKIQRGVRKWIERSKARGREPPAWQRPPGLTDDRRVQLQTHILEYRESHKLEHESADGRDELHLQVQGLIKQFAMRSRLNRKKQQSRELLTARLEYDSDLLLNAPPLKDSTEEEVEMYNSRSVPIATKARYNHAQELRILRQPWWKKLGDEYQDQKYEEDNSWKMF